MHSLSSRYWLHRAYSVAIVGVLGFAPSQGVETTTVVIEYRGPSNEVVIPIVLTSPRLTCAQAQQIMAARRVMFATSQCPIEVTSLELAALGRSLKALRPDSTGAINKEPELLRATILESDSAVTEVRISHEQAAHVLNLVARHISQDRYAALGARLSEMHQRISAPALVSLPSRSCGVQAAGVDDAVLSRIIYDLTRLPPTWSVRIQTSSNIAANRLLDLTSDGKRVWVSVSHLASSDDAAHRLRCHLQMIPVRPRYLSVAGVGDEAFVLTESHLLFRFGTFVFYVQSFEQSLDIEKAIARRLIASIQPGQSGDTTPQSIIPTDRACSDSITNR